MAKSQYTDSITGDVIVDIRGTNDKIFNFGSILPSRVDKNPYLTSSANKFSPRGLVFYSSISYRKIPMNTFTLSWWQNILSNDASGCWDGISISTSLLWMAFVARYNNGKPGLSIFKNSDSSRVVDNNSSISVFNNTWYHYSVTYDGTTYKMYRDGTLIISGNYSSLGDFIGIAINSLSTAIGHSIFDDICLIKNQVLWTSNFTVPNYFLTGDKDIPSKIYSRQLLYSSRIGDYYDKAFIY